VRSAYARLADRAGTAAQTAPSRRHPIPGSRFAFVLGVVGVVFSGSGQDGARWPDEDVGEPLPHAQPVY
jgi:hypothetical protein